MAQAVRGGPVEGGGLQRLLDLEAGLAERLAAVRLEVEGVRARARQAAAAAAAAIESRIAADESRLTNEAAAERDRELAALRAGFEARRARYLSPDPGRVEAIARRLVECVLVGSGTRLPP